MSSWGHGLLLVADGLGEVLAAPALAELDATLWLDGRTAISLPAGRAPGAPPAAAGITAADIELELARFPDAELVAAAPAAVWTLAMGADTEQPGLWLGYSPATGLVQAINDPDWGVAVPVAWTLPDAPPAAAAALRRVIAALAAFDAAVPRRPDGPGDPLLDHPPAAPTQGGDHAR